MIWDLARSLLFRLDAEEAHDFAARHVMALQEIPMVLELIGRLCAVPPGNPVRLWGLEFPSRLGLAAGFDKNAVMVPFLAALGFGFIEVGTVTLEAQPGNPKPRLFRFADEQALVNRLGFNNDGADEVARRLDRLWNIVEQRETSVERRWRTPVFVNIGKNRNVPLERAREAYAAVYRHLAPRAHGVVVNVSSPNTPGLRDLQSPVELAGILEAIREVREGLTFRLGGEHPVLVKIAPDLDDRQIVEMTDVCTRLADGIIATNTTTGRGGVPRAAGVAGGLSGRPLFGRSTEVLRRVRAATGEGYPLVGVGGVFSAGDVREKLGAGADLVEVYTGFVYGGPGMPSRVARELASNVGAAA